jgi:uncharacterized protein with HEPN domain
MTDPRAFDTLDQMAESAQLALGYVEGMDLASFRADRRTQQAVVLNLLVIGEAASRFAQDFPELAAQAGEIPWRSMRGMRNRIAHGYYTVDVDLVWRTTMESLPTLIDQVRRLRGALS